MVTAVPFPIAKTWEPPSACVLVNKKDMEQPHSGKLLRYLNLQLQI